MRRPPFGSLLLAAALAVGCGGPEPGPDPSPASSDAAPLRVGVEAKYPPFESVDAKGEFVGFDIDLARAIGASLGRPVKFTDMGWDSLIPELQAGRIDLVCSGMSWTAERAEIVDFTKPYAQSPMSVLVNVERAEGVTKLAQLDDAKVQIAVQRGTTGEKKAKASFPKASFREFDDENSAATEVATGRADAFVYDYLSVAKHHARHPGTTRILDESLGAEDYCIALRKGSPLRAEVQRALDEAAKPGGTIDALMDKWLPGAREKLKAK